MATREPPRGRRIARNRALEDDHELTERTDELARLWRGEDANAKREEGGGGGGGGGGR